MRRTLSTGVQIKPPIPAETLLLGDIAPDAMLRAYLPTETEVRDAMMRAAVELREMVQARTAGSSGWVVGDMQCQVILLENGEAALRGTVEIARPD